MNRHTILTLLALMMALAIALVGCGTAATPSPTKAVTKDVTEAATATEAATEAVVGGELHLYNWTTYMDPAVLDAFEAEYGVTVIEDFFGDNDELLAKIQPGNPGYDVIVPSDYMVEIMVSEGLLENLDHSKVPNISNLDSLFANPTYDPGLAHCVPYQWGTTGMGYNFEAVGRELDSWEVMFSGEFAGRISWLSDPRGTLGIVLMYLGYDPNTTNPDEVAKARDLLLATKGDIVEFAEDTGQNLLKAGDVDIAFEYGGDIYQIATEEGGEKFRYVIPKEGGILWTDNLCIPKDAPNPDLAHKFIDFILRPDIGAQLSNYIGYNTPNAASLPSIDPAVRDFPGLYPTEEQKKVLHTIQVIGDAEQLYTDAWTEIGVGQ